MKHKNCWVSCTSIKQFEKLIEQEKRPILSALKYFSGFILVISIFWILTVITFTLTKGL